MQSKKFLSYFKDQLKQFADDEGKISPDSFWPIITSSKSCIFAKIPKRGILQELIMSHKNMHINNWPVSYVIWVYKTGRDEFQI